jgi:hypothetical protein
VHAREAVRYAVDVLQASKAFLQTVSPSCPSFPVADASLLFCFLAKAFAILLKMLNAVRTPKLLSYSGDGVSRLRIDGLRKEPEYARI